MRTLVVTRYDENLSWIDNIEDDIVIYNKGFPLLPYEFKELPNIGREADSMLYHIVNNYHNLSDELVFLQGDPFDHCWDLLKLLEEKRNVDDVVWLGSNWGPVTKNYDGGPGHGCFLPMIKTSKLLFENCKFDNELLVIDTESSMTFLGFEENKEQKNRDRIREILEKKKQQTV